MTKHSAPPPMTCWVISDGRRGIENQALGLAEALGRLTPLTIERHIMTGSGLFKALPPFIQANIKKRPEAYALPKTPPSLVVGCGRQAIAPLLAIKKAFGTKTFTTYIQDPRIDPKHFDYVIAPEHDALSGANVDAMIGSPNRITPQKFEDALEAFKPQLAALPPKRVAVLIGGSSKTYTLTQATAQTHINTILELAKCGYGLMVSMSRRTPEAIATLYQDNLAAQPHIWIYTGTGDNPYFAFMAAADAILVTEESTNMLTEACSTGKPVFTLPMIKKTQDKASKFTALHAQLSKRCLLSPYINADALTARLSSSVQYQPLDETKRVSERLLQRLKRVKML